MVCFPEGGHFSVLQNVQTGRIHHGHSPGREADSSPKSYNELKNSRSCTPVHPFAFMVSTGTTSAGGISVELYFRRLWDEVDMIYLLTAFGLSPGGRSTVHIYTQTIHRTIQNKQYIEQHNNFERVRAVPRLG